MDDAAARQVMQQAAELEEVAQLQQQITGFTERCFKLCVPKPGSKLSDREQNCIFNCYGRYADTYAAVLSHLQAKYKSQ